MPDYTLKLNISTADLNVIKTAQLNIILAKPVSSGSPNVAWQVFDPFEGNIVTWTEEYGLYASNTAISNGATIAKMSTVALANDAAYYPFSSSATFTGPMTGVGSPPANSYMIRDDMPSSQYPSLVFGLMQSATINGVPAPSRPLNAVTVLSQFTATFTPYTTVYVWLQANLASETVVTQVVGNQTKVTFGGTVNSVSLTFNASTGTFVQDPAAKTQQASLTPASGQGALEAGQSEDSLNEALVEQIRPLIF